MPKTKTRFFLFPISGFFLFLDQFLKWQTVLYPSFTFYLYKDRIGWEFFKNYGVAFGIPIPNFAVIFLTPPILLGIILFLIKSFHNGNAPLSLALLLIIAGTISNYIDRVLYGYTIDYFRIFTSIINLGDLLISIGAIILFTNNHRKQPKPF